MIFGEDMLDSHDMHQTLIDDVGVLSWKKNLFLKINGELLIRLMKGPKIRAGDVFPVGYHPSELGVDIDDV